MMVWTDMDTPNSSGCHDNTRTLCKCVSDLTLLHRAMVVTWMTGWTDMDTLNSSGCHDNTKTLCKCVSDLTLLHRARVVT